MSADASPSTLPLRLEWLAGPQRRPVALCVYAGHPEPEAWAVLLAEPALHALCAALPCVLAACDGTPPPPITFVDTGTGRAPAAPLSLPSEVFHINNLGVITGVSAVQSTGGVAGLVQGLNTQVQHAPLVFPAQPSDGCWISGAWYQQPPAKLAAAQAASRARALQLLQLVSADADTHDIEAVLRHDAAVSYHLLRLVNSVAMGFKREITSLAQAILLLGRQQLRRWLQLLLFSARDDDPRCAMLAAHVTLRARSMELLAEACGLDRATQDQAFMVGMFSMLGTLFGQPLPQVLATLTLPDALRRALLDGEGTLGQLLTTVTAAEGPLGGDEPRDRDDNRLIAQLDALALPPATFNRLRLQAALWTVQMSPNQSQSPSPGPGQGAS